MLKIQNIVLATFIISSSIKKFWKKKVRTIVNPAEDASIVTLEITRGNWITLINFIQKLIINKGGKYTWLLKKVFYFIKEIFEKVYFFSWEIFLNFWKRASICDVVDRMEWLDHSNLFYTKTLEKNIWLQTTNLLTH